MTNEELISKIRKEIERLKEDVPCRYHPYSCASVLEAYEELLSFLSTLEEQAKGYDESYIQSKIVKASETWKGVDVDEYLSQVRGEVRNPIFDECVSRVDPEVMKEVSRNIEIEEELDRFIASGKSVTVDDCGTYKVSYHDFKKVARHFAEWQKEQDDKDLSEKIAATYQLGLADKEKQMTSKAVETELYWDGDFLAIDLNMTTLGYSEKDKVRVIVLPKED